MPTSLDKIVLHKTNLASFPKSFGRCQSFPYTKRISFSLFFFSHSSVFISCFVSLFFLPYIIPNMFFIRLSYLFSPSLYLLIYIVLSFRYSCSPSFLNSLHVFFLSSLVFFASLLSLFPRHYFLFILYFFLHSLFSFFLPSLLDFYLVFFPLLPPFPAPRSYIFICSLLFCFPSSFHPFYSLLFLYSFIQHCIS